MKNKFFDTALGKSVQTFLWTVASYGAAIGVADLSNVHWSSKAVALGLPGLINYVAYTIKVFLDKEVPNFPSSMPKQLVNVTVPPFVVGPEAAQPIDENKKVEV